MFLKPTITFLTLCLLIPPQFVKGQMSSSIDAHTFITSKNDNQRASTYLTGHTSYDLLRFSSLSENLNNLQSGFSTQLHFNHKNGFNATASRHFWQVADPDIPLASVGFGWRLNLSDVWHSSLHFERLFFQNDDEEKMSPMSQLTTFTLDYAPKGWLLSARSSYLGGQYQGLSLDISAAKVWQFKYFIGTKTTVTVMPRITLRQSTDNQIFFNRRIVKKDRKKIKDQRFRTVSYNFSLPIRFKKNEKWSFGTTLSYITPNKNFITECNYRSAFGISMTMTCFLLR